MPSGSISPHWSIFVLLAILIVAILSAVVFMTGERGSAFLSFRGPTTSRANRPKVGLWTGLSDQRCTVDQYVKVLGRVLDRCATEEAARLVVEEDIYVSIKTTARYHNSRVLPSLQTWFQTVPADRIHVVTDDKSNRDTLYEIASKTGIEVVFTDCSQAWTREVLCCKSGNEYFHYFSTTTKTGDLHKWYCHFDDDMYVNIPVLVKGLREAWNKSTNGGVYYGRWPQEDASITGVNVPAETLKHLGYDVGGQLSSIKWATGAAYCISSTVMLKIEKMLTKHTFKTYCKNFFVGDDVTAAVLAGMAGYRITHTDKIRTQYDKARHKPLPPSVGFKELMTVSYGMYSGHLKDDPSGFLAYHCLLYPSTSWCRKRI